MNYQTILFDLDGTLTESGPGIMHAVAYALAKMGFPAQSEEVLRRFVGPPLAHSFVTFCGMEASKTDEAISLYHEYYLSGGMFENEVYAGVEEMLKALKKAGKTLAVATSKPEELSIQILEHFHLLDYFKVVCGASRDLNRLGKAEVITYALETLQIPESAKSEVLMVGDREYDMRGARANGLASMGVLYGYGDREELENAGADYIVETAQEAVRLLLEQ